jgi:hypothetical protein
MSKVGKRVRTAVQSLPRDSLVSTSLRRAKGEGDCIRWRAGRRLGPPPSLYKRRVLRQTADRHSLRVLVETGTYKGDTVAALRRRFDRIISIELSPIYAERARRRFAADANVSIIEGDSASVLWEVVDALREPALFWLDGHASGGETARGTAGSPVSTEVDVVLRSRYGHVVLIDDARCFDGSDGYPTLHDLRERVRELGGGSLDLTVADDIIRLVPSER